MDPFSDAPCLCRKVIRFLGLRCCAGQTSCNALLIQQFSDTVNPFRALDSLCCVHSKPWLTFSCSLISEIWRANGNRRWPDRLEWLFVIPCSPLGQAHSHLRTSPYAPGTSWSNKHAWSFLRFGALVDCVC